MSYSDDQLRDRERARLARSFTNQERFQCGIKRAQKNPNKIVRIQCRNSHQRYTVHQLAGESHLEHRSIINYYFVHKNNGDFTPFSCVELNNGFDKKVIGSPMLFNTRCELKTPEMNLEEDALMWAQHRFDDTELMRFMNELFPWSLMRIVLDYRNTNEDLKKMKNNWLSLRK